jgi:hypothetical protein
VQVSDLYLMGKATIEEGRSLLQWLRDDYGHQGLLGVTGVSMGAAMATAVGCAAPFEYVLCSTRTRSPDCALELLLRHVSPPTRQSPSTPTECLARLCTGRRCAAR